MFFPRLDYAGQLVTIHNCILRVGSFIHTGSVFRPQLVFMASEWDPSTVMPNLTNKIAVVTGGR